MTPRRLLQGSLAGLAATALLALADVLMGGQRFGLMTGVTGVATGFLALVMALALSLTSYWLASKNRAPALRRRLLFGSIWTGAAGMACGFTSTVVWLVAGRPWFT